jgi:hypothetical protein
MQELKATKPGVYGGKRLAVGDVFMAKTSDAKVLIALKRADVYVPAVKTRAKPAKVERREEVQEAAPVAEGYASAALGADDEAQPKRRYKRRDMQASE